MINRYVKALSGELREWGSRVHGPLEFVYFGGGTPSVLSGAQWETLFNTITDSFTYAPNVEITSEVHPTHATIEGLRLLRSVGVSRVSMGVQSFQEQSLSSLGATHTANHSHQACEAAMNIYDDVAIDLLYAHSEQSAESWELDLQLAISQYVIPHLSCYAVVPIAAGARSSTPATEISMAVKALNMSSASGLLHYASCASGGFDVCRPGSECQYELQHWRAPQAQYCACGPGAFGFVDGYLTANAPSLDTYLDLCSKGRLPVISAKRISSTEMMRRYFVLGVKTLAIRLDTFKQYFLEDALTVFKDEIATLCSNGLATIEAEELKLTSVGSLYVDSCSALFFSPSERVTIHPEEPELRALERVTIHGL
jgi:oxygen-independent coproporphyrinogen-3 oxidase